ncbi:MAG TPA: gluconokinase, partial [Acidimicrobiales bacterium]|nr:gluconokinase [Acidimicrobiales bacterium]
DVGTTGVKAAAFAPGSSRRRVAVREYPLVEPQPGQEVQDPDRILAATASAMTECIAAADGADILAVSLSAAMHGLLALDADRRPLTPLITWADGRASEEARALQRSPEAAELVKRTGIPVHPMTPLTKLMWFGRHEPGIWAAARWWVGLKDYLLAWLTGTLATELSSASGTGLLDLSTRTWSPLALETCGLSPDRLPPILATTATLSIGRAAAPQIGLPAGTPVVVGAADGPLANLGTGAMQRGTACLSLGTSGALRMTTDEPRLDELGVLFCYALTDQAWVVGRAISNGASVVRWAGSSLAPDVLASAGASGPDEPVLELAATVEAGCDGLVMLPFLVAERAPLWGPDLHGAYLGLRRDHTRAHFVRAAIEGVCIQMRLILDQLDSVGQVSSVLATGGAFRSALWRQVMAAALDRPLHVVEGAEGTALGAAALGLFALGRAASLSDAVDELTPPDSPPPAPVTVPNDLVATYARLRSMMPELVDAIARDLPG